MKLDGYRETFYTFSEKASDLNRQLGFAGIALIWLFKRDDGGPLAVPKDLIFPAALIVISLAFDMLHYCVASLIWRLFYRHQEKAGLSEQKDIRHSEWLELPIWLLFVAKIGCVVAAYLYIFVFLLDQLDGLPG